MPKENRNQSGSVFEVHRWSDERLPFIYHYDKVEHKPYNCGNWHDSLEILSVTSGVGSILCDTNRYTMKKGDTVVIDSNAVHTIASDGSVEYHCLIVGRTFCIENGLDIEHLHFTTHIENAELFSLVEKAAREFVNNTDESSRVVSVRSAVMRVLALLACEFSEPLPKKAAKKSSDTVKSGLVYINSNYTSEMTADEIAAAAGSSKYHFLRRFKRYTGYTVTEYVNMLRCEYARRLLVGTDDPIGEIAARCGFENMSYFSKTFRKYVGKTPSAVRK